MSKKIYLFSLVLLALAFVSCSETEEEGKFANWRARNEAFLDSLQQVYDAKTDPELEFCWRIKVPRIFSGKVLIKHLTCIIRSTIIR